MKVFQTRAGARAWAACAWLAVLMMGCSDAQEVSLASEEVTAEATEPLTVTGAVVSHLPTYSGIWADGGASQFLRQRYARTAFQNEWQAQYNLNFRLKSMAINAPNGIVEFSGVWTAGSAGQALRLGRTYEQFIADYDEWWNKGYRLAELKTYVANGVLYYNGIWNPSTSGQYLRLGRTKAQFLTELETRYAEGYRLISIASDLVNGVVYYHGVWNPSTVRQSLYLTKNRAEFTSNTATLAGLGYRLVVADTYTVNNETFYDAVYNQSTVSQDVTLGDGQAAFVSQFNTHVTAGRRLQSFISDQVEGLSLDLFATDLQNKFNGKMVGMAATIAANAQSKAATVGQRRTATDTAQPASADSRVNVASVSKTITAAGVLHALRARGLTPDTRIGAYLPSNWTRGVNVDNITFRRLFTHTSGFREPDTLTYQDLKAHVAAGVRTVDQVPAYRNTNYALFRVILPYLAGFDRTGISEANMPAALSNAFMSYMNANVFTPSGIAPIGLIPSGSTRTLCYPFPAGSTPGIDYGDFTDLAGGAGYQLSSNQLAKFLVALDGGAILPQSWISTMDEGLLGWQSFNSSRHGGYRVHGGYFPPQPGELNSLVLNFASGVQFALEINSGVQKGLDVLGSIVTGYNNSWVPVAQ